ncbi:MAG: hypothetical protein VXY93_10090, partial [Pseudomonadota bacterium]|nr:hypothetical protein [Pseudomonadota bacterium]
GNLPSAGSYHGMFAHVHATGRGYFAHAGNWLELVNREINGVVGTGTETYNIGNLVSTSSTTTSLNVSGVTTAVTLDVNGDLDVDGHTNLDNVSVAGVTTFSDRVRVLDDKKLEFGNSADLKIRHDSHSGSPSENMLVNSSIINYRGYLRIANFGNANNTGHSNANSMFIDAHTHQFRDQQSHLKAKFIENSAVELYHDGNLKFNTASSGINVVGTTTSTQLAITGVSTFTGAIDANGDLDVDGHTELDNVNIAGVVTATTFKGALQGTSGTFSSGVDITGDLDVDGHTDLDNVSIAGVVTATTFVGNGDFVELDVDGHTNLDNVNVAGVSTFSGVVSGVQVNLQSTGGELINVTSTTAASRSTIKFNTNGNDWEIGARGSSADNPNNFYIFDNATTSYRMLINSTGVVSILGDLDVDGHTNLDNVSVAGVTTFTGNANFGSNGLISSAANFSLTSNKLRVTGSDTVGIECQRAGNATIQCTDTSNSTDLQLRANSSGGLVRTATNYPLILGANQREKLRIAGGSYATIGINTSTFDTAGAQLKIEGRGTG